MNVHDQNIAVLGLARSGEAVARLLSSHGAKVTVFDSGNSAVLEERAKRLRKTGIIVQIGSQAVPCDTFYLAVVSPGIDLASPFVRQFSDAGVSLSGELEVAWQFCKKPVIAITGTNGKTTTTELICSMLNRAGRRTVACGNIGLPFSEVVAGQQDALDLITLEVSSFQLETISTFHPHIALWLNFSADHLDRYASLADYQSAKLRIFENQDATDFAICNAADSLPPVAAQCLSFSAQQASADFAIRDGQITFQRHAIAPLASFQLTGSHNAENLMAALATGHVLGIALPEMLPALQAYRPAPHRCELVAVVEGVRYINDSKATNVDALAKALTSCPGRVVLIAGGKDKGFAFSSLQSLIAEKVSTAILIGEMAERIRGDWESFTDCHLASTLQDAVLLAHHLAAAGGTVLFSPGTSSFDMFRDYADRGEQFRTAANNLLTIESIQ